MDMMIVQRSRKRYSMVILTLDDGSPVTDMIGVGSSQHHIAHDDEMDGRECSTHRSTAVSVDKCGQRKGRKWPVSCQSVDGSWPERDFRSDVQGGMSPVAAVLSFCGNHTRAWSSIDIMSNFTKLQPNCDPGHINLHHRCLDQSDSLLIELI